MKRISTKLLLAAAAIVVALWFMKGRAGFQDAPPQPPSQPDPNSIPLNRPEVYIPFFAVIGTVSVGGAIWAYFTSKKIMAQTGEKPWY